MFQSKLLNSLSKLRAPAHFLRLGMMSRKIRNTLCSVSAERQGKEENIFGKKKGKYCANGAMVTLKKRLQFTALSFYLSGPLSLLKHTICSTVIP